MAKITAIIFDLDGTLVDTEPAAAAAVQDCFARWRIGLVAEDAAFVTGRTWDNAFNYLFGKYTPPVPVEQAREAILSEYRRRIEEELTIVPGSADAVHALCGAHPLGLVSGSHRREILWALEKLAVREKFRVILGAEDYPRSKPAPDGYLKAIRQLGVAPENTLVFEDSQAGIASALAAGTWVVAITGTNHFSQDISGAHLSIPDLRGIHPEWLRNAEKKW